MTKARRAADGESASPIGLERASFRVGIGFFIDDFESKPKTIKAAE